MSNAIREITRLMDKRAKQPQAVTININGSGPTSIEGTHNHDDRYYTEGEVDTLLSGKSDTTHNHDTDYSDIAHSHTLEGLSDVPAYTGNAGKFVKINATEDGVEYGEATGGASAFTSLTDAPASYVGQGGKLVAVKSTADGLEFVSAGSGSGDMTKAVYDTDEDGTVDEAENALAIDGVTVDLTGIADGYILYYDSTSGKILAKQDSGGGGEADYFTDSGFGAVSSTSLVFSFLDSGVLQV